jgi:2,5-diketo-D-gluconate reductase A
MIERLQFPDSWNSPALPGYGTFPAPFVRTLGYEQAARSAQEAVEQALACGYRHLDTAFAYRNQDLLGAAVRAQRLSRAEVFVTSKLHPYNNTHAEALVRIDEAIRLIWGEGAAGTKPYLDAFLIHYPGFGNPVEAWKALLEARTRGLLKHAGVSNFEIGHLQKLHESCGHYPELNQIELHPYIYLEQKELIGFCKAKGIAVEGYCPLAEGQVLDDPELRVIAAAHDTSAAKVALRWCMQHGVRPIVGSRNPSHIKANAEGGGLNLSPEEMNKIDRLSSSRTVRVSLKWHWNPRTAPLGGPNPNSVVRGLLRRCASLFGRN